MPGVVVQPGRDSRVFTVEGAPVEDIHKAVISFTSFELDRFLEKDPKKIHDRAGLHNETVLHAAARKGDTDIVKVFIKHGADVNATNSNLETPLHIASRAGSLQIIHTLVQAGAEANLLNAEKKSMIHYACMGGGMYSLIYLHEVCGLSCNVKDHAGVTPLHVAACHGHVECMNFLLRKQRCDPFIKDSNGNTCLHVAAQFGNALTCWKLLEAHGLQWLHQRNNAGQTPLDIAMKGDQFRGKETAKLLGTYSAVDTKAPVRGPLFQWYQLLLLPIVVFPSVIGFSQLFEAQRGVVVVLGLLFLLIVIFRQSHRMKHISQWPNPIYMGMFAAGFLYTHLCYLTQIMADEWQDHTFLAWLSLILMVWMMHMYYRLLMNDPGVITHSAEIEEKGQYSIKDVAKGILSMDAYCVMCEVVPPYQGRHCRLCGKCYYDMDHHCLFLYRCVARNTHRLFVTFITVVMVSMSLFEYICVVHLGRLLPKSQGDYFMDWNMFWIIFNQYPWIWSCMIANALSLIWGFTLLKFQFKVITLGQTTAWQLKKGASGGKTFRQKLNNFVNFFRGRYYLHHRKPITLL